MKTKSALPFLAPLVAMLALSGPLPGRASDFPARPISLIVPFGPGGATDIVARVLAEEASSVLKQQIVILNKAGASATIGTADTFRAKPDGYTLLLGDNISTVFQPQRMPLPYRGPEDFQPILKVAVIPNVLVVSADSPWKTLDQFVTAARAKPGAMRVSTAGPFTGTDLNIREFNQLAGIETTTVPVSGGTAPAVALLLGGHVEAVVAAPSAVVSFVQAQKVRPLAVFAKQRIGLFPDLPTAAELGYKTTMGVMVFVSAPKNLDNVTLDKLQAGFAEAIAKPRFREFARQNGYQLDPLGPQELGKELADWRQYFVKLSQQLGPQVPN
jgi:tripartite-type tricarboxylate transporter receptor subunit TctC